MTISQITYLVPFVAASVTALLGLLALVQPARAARWYGIATQDLNLVRSHWGGAPLLSSLFCLYWQAPSAFWGVGMVWLGLAAMRLAQFRSQAINWRIAAVEWLLTIGLLVGLVTG